MSELGAARLALAADLRALDPDLRSALSDEWVAVAEAAQAAVARFAHFALELLAVGAPPELLEGANRAALDELARAKHCFELASLYAGRELGPAPLPLSSIPPPAFDLASIVERVVAHGCVDETLSLAELQLLAARPLPAALADTLALLASGASEKLELAYTFLRFALVENGALVRPAAERAFERSLAARRSEPLATSRVPELVLRGHGRLTPLERQAVRHDALEQLVRPAAKAALRGN